MKVYLQYKKRDQSGKCKFLKRLIPALADLGVQVKREPRGCDVALGISKWRGKPPKLPRVLRMDGIYLRRGKKEDWRNKEIKQAIKASDYVIFQSDFCRRMVKKVLHQSPPGCVIHNGADPANYADVVPQYKPCPFMVAMVASWGCKKQRKDKHLGWHLDIAKQMVFKNLGFWLIGETPQRVEATDNLYVVGRVGEEVLRQYLVAADAMLYLADPDWCPNSVVEALVAGVPVVCLKGNGVEEIVRHNGTACSLKEVPKALASTIVTAVKAEAPYLHIGVVARQYKEALSGLLGC